MGLLGARGRAWMPGSPGPSPTERSESRESALHLWAAQPPGASVHTRGLQPGLLLAPPAGPYLCCWVSTRIGEPVSSANRMLPSRPKVTPTAPVPAPLPGFCRAREGQASCRKEALRADLSPHPCGAH